jgi:hypothetical protein
MALGALQYHRSAGGRTFLRLTHAYDGPNRSLPTNDPIHEQPNHQRLDSSTLDPTFHYLIISLVNDFQSADDEFETS